MSDNHNNFEKDIPPQPKKTVDESNLNLAQPQETVIEPDPATPRPQKTVAESATNQNYRPSFVRKNSLEGKTIGDNHRYLLQTLLGEGGMSKVYRALDTKFEDRVVAIKVMTNYSAVNSQHLIKRFMGEVKAISRLKHPNIIQILDYGITPKEAPFFGVPFYVMEYFTGKTLKNLLLSNQTLSLDSLLNIISQVCAGLKEAHQKGIIHRDLKPENIFLVAGGVLGEIVKIIDFGIAKNIDPNNKNYTQLTQEGSFIGTYRYASPEQCRGLKNIDQRTDIYSLGIILYEAISGKNPYNLDEDFSTTQADWIACHIRVPPKPLREQPECENIEESLNNLVMKCLAKSPEARFANVRELQTAFALVSVPNIKTKQHDENYSQVTTVEAAKPQPQKTVKEVKPQPVKTVSEKLVSKSNPDISPKSNQGKKSTGLVASIVVILMGIIGAGGYWLWKQPQEIAQNKPNNSTINSQPEQNPVIPEPDLSSIIENLENQYQKKNYQQCYDLAIENINQNNILIQEWLGKCGLAMAEAKAQANSYSGAIAIAQKIPKTVPNYQEIANQINSWAENILEYATKIYQEKGLEAAVKITQVIPDSSAIKSTIPNVLAQWQQETEQHQAIISKAQNLLNQGQWSQAKQEIAKIPSNFVLWREKAQPILNKANTQINAIAEAEKRRREQEAAEKRRREQEAAAKRLREQKAAEKRRREQEAAARYRRDRQTLGQAIAIANSGNYPGAIAKAQTISRGSALYSEARAKINYWQRKIQEQPLREL